MSDLLLVIASSFMGLLSFALPVLFIGIGFLLIRSLARMRRQAQQAPTTWQRTTGRVLVSQALPLPSAEGVTPMYFADVRYEYTVGQRIYRGDRITLADYSVTHTAVQRTVARYTVGQMVQVYFDPQRPAQSALELRLGSSVRPVLGAIFGGSFLVFGILFILAAFLPLGLYLWSWLAHPQ